MGNITGVGASLRLSRTRAMGLPGTGPAARAALLIALKSFSITCSCSLSCRPKLCSTFCTYSFHCLPHHLHP